MAELSEGEIPDGENDKKKTEKSDFISELQNQIDQLVGENKYLKSKMKVLHEENLRIRRQKESERRRCSRPNELNDSRYKHHETTLRFSRSRPEKTDSCKTRNTTLRKDRSWSGGETSRRGSRRNRENREQSEKRTSLPHRSTITPSPTTPMLKPDYLGNHLQGCTAPEISNNQFQKCQAAQLAAAEPPVQPCPTIPHHPSTTAVVDTRDMTSRERWPLKRKADSSTDVVATTKNPETRGSSEGGSSAKIIKKKKTTDTPPPKSTVQLRNRVRKVKKDDDAILERRVESEEESYELSFSLLGNSVMKKLSTAPRIDSAPAAGEEKEKTADQPCGDGKQAKRENERAAGSDEQTADEKFKKPNKEKKREKKVVTAGKSAAESRKEKDGTGKKGGKRKERKKEAKIGKKTEDGKYSDDGFDAGKKKEHVKKIVVFGGDDNKKKQGDDPQQPPIKVRFLLTPTPPPSTSDEGEAEKGKATISVAPQTSCVSSHLLFYRNGAMNQLLSLVFKRYEKFKRKREQVSHEKRASLWTDCSEENVICNERSPRQSRGKSDGDEKKIPGPLLDAKRRPSTESYNKEQEQASSILPTPPLLLHDNGGKASTSKPPGVRKESEVNVQPPLNHHHHHVDVSNSCFIPEESMLRMCEPPPPMLSPFKTQDDRIAPLLSKPAVAVATDDKGSRTPKRPRRRRKLFSDNLS